MTNSGSLWTRRPVAACKHVFDVGEWQEMWQRRGLRVAPRHVHVLPVPRSRLRQVPAADALRLCTALTGHREDHRP